MASLEFRLNEIDETRNYILEKIKHINLMSQKYKKMCRSLKYCEHFLVLISLVSWCVSVSAFASLTGVPVSIASSVVETRICAITAGIKKYKSIINKKRKNHDKIELLAKRNYIQRKFWFLSS